MKRDLQVARSRLRKEGLSTPSRCTCSKELVMHGIRSLAMVAVVCAALVGSLGLPSEAAANSQRGAGDIVRLDTAVLYVWSPAANQWVYYSTYIITLDVTGTVVLDMGGVDFAQSIIENQGGV